jgi:prolyl-tRNA synthetase
MVGGLIMTHGDDSGLRVPPVVAPIQVVVLLAKEGDGAGETAGRLATELRAAGVRTELDARADLGFGRRSVDWELKGVPLRIEVGPRDLAAGNVVLVQRATGVKQPVALGEVVARVPDLLVEIQSGLLAEATARRDAMTFDVATIEEAMEAATGGFARVPWSVLRDGDGENRLRQQGITVRCLRRPDGTVPDSEDEADSVAYVARAY